jgi:hypothetical protein
MARRFRQTVRFVTLEARFPNEQARAAAGKRLAFSQICTAGHGVRDRLSGAGAHSILRV